MEFNEKQLIAIESDSPHKVIVAPAGSGKTSVIVGAIQRYRKLHPDDHIVAITFTRKASAELKQRIDIENNIEISTIHSWAWRELQRLADEYNFKVQLLEENAIKDILKQICKLKRQYYLNQFQLYSYVMGNYNVDVDENIKKTFEYIRTEYIKFKQKNKLYDFTDLPNYLYDKLFEYYETIKTIDALFVDEFQDIDPVQYDLFTLVEAKEKCYIGDSAQAIYQFRGSVEEVFEKLDGFDFYGLDINYRSYQEILDYASTLRKEGLERISHHGIIELCDIEELSRSPITCIRGKGGNVYRIPCIGECINLADD